MPKEFMETVTAKSLSVISGFLASPAAEWAADACRKSECTFLLPRRHVLGQIKKHPMASKNLGWLRELESFLEALSNLSKFTADEIKTFPAEMQAALRWYYQAAYASTKKKTAKQVWAELLKLTCRTPFEFRQQLQLSSLRFLCISSFEDPAYWTFGFSVCVSTSHCFYDHQYNEVSDPALMQKRMAEFLQKLTLPEDEVIDEVYCSWGLGGEGCEVFHGSATGS